MTHILPYSSGLANITNTIVYISEFIVNTKRKASISIVNMYQIKYCFLNLVNGGVLNKIVHVLKHNEGKYTYC